MKKLRNLLLGLAALALLASAGAYGSSVLSTDNPLERDLRDVHAAGQHIAVQPSNDEVVEQLLGPRNLSH